MNESGIEDVVRSLGYLTLGTRLKRIGERLQSQTQRILEGQKFAIPAGQFPFLAAIDRSGPMTVGDLATAVGVSQPAATRSLSLLAEAGFVAIGLAKDDQRRKHVTLTASGKRLVERGKRTAWPLIEAAVKDLCEGSSASLLEQLGAIEDGLDAQSLDTRALRKRKQR